MGLNVREGTIGMEWEMRDGCDGGTEDLIA